MFLGGGGDILDEFRRMERAMTRALEPPSGAGRGPLARTQTTTRANNGDSRRSQSEVRFSSSSYAYSYRGPGGPDGAPAHFEDTAQSRGVAGPRVETVTETKRSYKDSTGRERHGVSRTVGDRGRRVTRERDGVSGEERCEDRLLATEDGEAFDRDWAAAAAASELHDERRFPSLNAFGADEFHSLRTIHPGGRPGTREEPPRLHASFREEPDVDRRRVASAARETHAVRTRRLAEEARRMASRR